MSEGYRLIVTPKLHFRYQVVRPDGLPDIQLTVVAHKWLHSLSESSVPVYMREVLAFLNWTLKDSVTRNKGWQFLGPPADVRNLIWQYLCVGTDCKLTRRADRHGLKVTYISRTAGTRINVRIFLSALKRVFETMIAQGMYPHPNPLRQEQAAAVATQLRERYREAVRSTEGRGPLPASSGIDHPPKDLRLSENYFRFADGQWVPRTIDDPDLPNLVCAAGKRHGWGLREMCIVRTLFESGARISEILDLTAADWSVSHFLNRFAARSKGSHGLRTKTLVVSKATAAMYRRLFESRPGGSSAGRALLTVSSLEHLLETQPEQLPGIRIFLTARGTPLTPKLFRDHYWRPALRAAGIDADPHSGRHWFVTNALKTIERIATDSAELARRKEELIQYMAWSSGERTMNAYEHIRREERFLETMQVIHRDMSEQERRHHEDQASDDHGAAPTPSAVSSDLRFILGDDNDN